MWVRVHIGDDKMKYAIKVNNKYYDPSKTLGSTMSDPTIEPCWMDMASADNHCQAFNRRHQSGMFSIVVDAMGREYTTNQCLMRR